MPEGTEPAGRFAFVRVGKGATSVGLMTGLIREVNMRLATVEIAGVVHRVRVLDDRLWVAADDGIAAYSISGDHLLGPVEYPVAGVRDLEFVGDRRAAVVGVFGRALVRFDRDGSVHTVHEHREPAGLLRARCDGRFVQAGGAHGWWQYDPSGRVQRLETIPADVAPPPLTAATVAGRARVSDDGRSVVLPGGLVHTEPGTPVVSCIVAVEGNLWIGHERGITVLGQDGHVIDRLWLDGPVRYVFPLAAGGAVWVSESGGFGTLAYEDQS